ncbi:SdiA-regulated domain-containing protein [Lutimonas halocynthiae]|uniref:SdiA-regulated domain-containing protein n=1 Tax=Lutimonas halocynthiae TaxID=1446477 RepID=UPI0025B45A6F|nr:SdiA-regulated domain-containing protein [Lutimonas halocynthiae]MDN3641222.1 SdiA-regulated domain-containing protein [Lutimonas halocynthiae]
MLLLKKTIIIFIGIIISTSCDAYKNTKLELEASYKIDVSEPSGLSVNNSGTALYTVSDRTSTVYKLSMTGDIIETYDSKGSNLEGVSTYTENKLLLAEESKKKIVVLDMLTGKSSKHKIKYKNKDRNSGIEGVTFDSNSNTIFILNEKKPGKLMRLRNDFSVLAMHDLNFAADYSGIFYENTTNLLWILSDQSKTINKCTLSGELIESFNIMVAQPEGIAVTDNYIYIVCDTNARLYVYKKP